MEQTLNKSGNLRGLHGNSPKGKANVKSKGWILYKWDEEVGFFSSISECAAITGLTKQYMWILAREKAMNVDGPRKQTSQGWSIKPAESISFSDK